MANTWQGAQALHNTDAVNDVNSINQMMSQRESTRLSNTYDLTGGYDIVGINANNVPDTITAIEDYIKKIEDKVKQMNESANMNVALRSDVIQSAVKNYITKVEEYCVNLTSQLRFFKERLEGARDAWEKHAQELSETISQDTNSFDAGTHKQ